MILSRDYIEGFGVSESAPQALGVIEIRAWAHPKFQLGALARGASRVQVVRPLL